MTDRVECAREYFKKISKEALYDVKEWAFCIENDAVGYAYGKTQFFFFDSQEEAIEKCFQIFPELKNNEARVRNGFNVKYNDDLNIYVSNLFLFPMNEGRFEGVHWRCINFHMLKNEAVESFNVN